MASRFFNNHLEQMADVMYNSGSVPSGTIKLALFTTSYTFDETDAFFSDLSGEASGTNYTTGGSAVAGLTIAQDDASDGATVDFNDVTFSNVTLTNVNAYVLYYDTGVTSTSQLIAYVEFAEGAQSTVGNDFTVQPNASGVFLFSS